MQDFEFLLFLKYFVKYEHLNYKLCNFLADVIPSLYILGIFNTKSESNYLNKLSYKRYCKSYFFEFRKTEVCVQKIKQIFNFFSFLYAYFS